MTVLVTQLLKSEFVANVSKLFAGKGVAFAITLGAAPVIARLYDPADYGVIGIFVAACSILSIIATLKYEVAVVLPRSDVTARAVFLCATRLSLIFCLILAGLIAIATTFMQDLEAVRQLGVYIWCLPVAIFLVALSRSMNRWLTRTREFGRMASSDVSTAAATTSLRIGAGLVFGSTVAWLVLSYLIGALTKLVYVLPQLRQALQPVPDSRAATLAVLKEYSEFPKFTMPADFIRSIAQNMPLLMFGFMYSPVVAGLYYMAYRLILAPVGLVLQAFRSVYLQKMVALHNTATPLRGAYLSSIAIMAGIGLAPTLLLAFYGQEILTFILGQKWTEAGRFAEILAPLLFSYWISSPAATLLVVLRKQQYWLFVQALTALCQLLALIYAYLTAQSATWALWSFVLIQFVINLGMKLVVLGLLDRQRYPDEPLPDASQRRPDAQDGERITGLS